jgi:hypothetical protein
VTMEAAATAGIEITLGGAAYQRTEHTAGCRRRDTGSTFGRRRAMF